MPNPLEFYDKEDRPWPSKRLKSAAIVGHTTAESARIWFRAAVPGRYVLVVADREIDTRSRPFLAEDGTARLRQPDGTDIAMPGLVVHTPRRRRIEFDTDITHTFDVRGLDELSPGSTRFYYAVFHPRAERWEVGRDHVHTFRTPAASFAKVTFGLLSCHMPFKGRNVLNMHMWKALRQMLEAEDADFVVAGGDQVYSDGDDEVSIWRWLRKVKSRVAELSRDEQVAVMRSWYRDIYRGYWGDLELRRVFRSWPTYMIWDDHEIMDGWGSYKKDELSDTLDSLWEWENQRENLSLAHNMFEAAKRTYMEYQHSHNPKTPDGQWDYTFEWNGCAFFVMDVRGHRDYERRSFKILGRSQLHRLEAWLADSAAASALFIVSPVPVLHLKDFVMNHLDLTILGLADDLRDEWEHGSNHTERDRMLERVFELSHSTGKKVVFLSGDVHISAAFKLWRKNRERARVYQLTSSGITYAKAPGRALKLAAKKHGNFETKEDGRKVETHFRRLDLFEENNFGLVTVKRGPGGDAHIAWDLYGTAPDEGEVVRRRRIMLD